MKALTICQPYATLIALGEKRVENRTWRTGYRGPLAIHAGLSRKWLGTYDPLPDDMPFGAFVAVAYLAACFPIEACRKPTVPRWDWIRTHEHAEGPYCWILEDVRPLVEPIPYGGSQGLWDVPNEVIERLT